MANQKGKAFLNSCRAAIAEASKADSPEQAARLAVFALLTMLDGSSESFERIPHYRVFEVTETAGLEPVRFFHHEL